MSRERARRRAEREALAARARVARARQVARRARRRALCRAAGRPFRGVGRLRRSRPDSALRRHRARQDGALLIGLIAVNGLLWLANLSLLARGSALVLSVLAWPLLVVLVFDRSRSS